MLLTRLPVDRILPDRTGGEPPDLTRSVWAYPLVGAIASATGAAALLAAAAVGGGPWTGAFLALAGAAVVTGAFHEDGLADTADGLGGGQTKDQKLAIMRDSRIGTYGTVALVLSFGLRASALATMGEALSAALALIAAGTLGRAVILFLLALLPPARSDGLAVVAGRPPADILGPGFVIAAAVTLACLPTLAALAAAGAAALAGLCVAALARRCLGGYTGDVLGAGAQLGEIAVLISVSLT